MSGNAAAVVYVHGLWMPGHESALLRRRLAAERGLHLSVFHYDSVHEGMAQIATRLHALLEPIEAPQVHLLGHSLGGLVILRCLERYPMTQPGRVVFMGTPSAGSRAARRLAPWAWGRRALGRPWLRNYCSSARGVGTSGASWASLPAPCRWDSRVCW